MKTTRILMTAGIATLSTWMVAQADTLSLAGTGHTGYAAALGINPEPNGFAEDSLTIANPSLPSKSHFGMPYYNDGTHWNWLVTTPLSSSSSYSIGTTVYNTSSTDTHFGVTDLGEVTFSKAGLVGGTGTVVVPASAFALNLFDLSPKWTQYNDDSNNEFNWTYFVDNASGSVTLTFVNGALTSVDGTLSIGVGIRFADIPGGEFTTSPSTFGWDEEEGDFVITPGPTANYEGTLTFSGNSFAFDVDDDFATVYSFLGTLSNTGLIINRSGTFSLTTTP